MMRIFHFGIVLLFGGVFCGNSGASCVEVFVAQSVRWTSTDLKSARSMGTVVGREFEAFEGDVALYHTFIEAQLKAHPAEFPATVFDAIRLSKLTYDGIRTLTGEARRYLNLRKAGIEGPEIYGTIPTVKELDEYVKEVKSGAIFDREFDGSEHHQYWNGLYFTRRERELASVLEILNRDPENSELFRGWITSTLDPMHVAWILSKCAIPGPRSPFQRETARILFSDLMGPYQFSKDTLEFIFYRLFQKGIELD